MGRNPETKIDESYIELLKKLQVRKDTESRQFRLKKTRCPTSSLLINALLQYNGSIAKDWRRVKIGECAGRTCLMFIVTHVV